MHAGIPALPRLNNIAAVNNKINSGGIFLKAKNTSTIKGRRLTSK